MAGVPCDKDGQDLPPFAKPTPLPPRDAKEGKPWHPFNSRLAFDWAHFNFVEVQTSEQQVNRGLDLWLAATIAAGGNAGVPWTSAAELYQTIDAIQEGDAPWKTIKIKYDGPKPPTPPKWMEETYELCVRNVLVLTEQQLGSSAFAGKFHPAPYCQFNHKRDRVWSDLSSGDWMWDQAVGSRIDLYVISLMILQDLIAEDPAMRGAFYVPMVNGSDKTTVSVGTGHQEYHPEYTSPGPLTNIAHRGHGNAVLPTAFLPIPKGRYSLIFYGYK